jgi:excisionase family DNA binding protein
MAKKPDLYTVTQASKILGVSVKRVRQMIQEGKLEAYSLGPVKLKQLDILAMRNQRETEGKINQSDKGAATNTEVLLALQGLNNTFMKQLEAVTDSNRRNEENYLQQINELRAEVQRLQQIKNKKFWQK